jgi:adenine/guanine phosphoribosyltransferase-like PRPP-binding protein
MSDRIALSFSEISRRLHALDLPPVDYVVGIATGGIVPASLIAHQIERPLALVHLNFRDPGNQPRYDAPRLLGADALPPEAERILLVDDVSVTGSTLEAARAALAPRQITTLVLKGQGDFVLFPEVPQCVDWPWKVERLTVTEG